MSDTKNKPSKHDCYLVSIVKTHQEHFNKLISQNKQLIAALRKQDINFTNSGKSIEEWKTARLQQTEGPQSDKDWQALQKVMGWAVPGTNY